MKTKLKFAMSLMIGVVSGISIQVTAAPAPKSTAVAKPNSVKKTAPVDLTEKYMSQVRPIIEKAWKPPTQTTGSKITVAISIAASGKIEDIKVTEPSGDEAFDAATISSLKTLAQLPPLPANLPNGLTVNYKFNAGNRNPNSRADNEAYAKLLSQRVHATWSSPKVSKNMDVVVSITINKQGQLAQATISKSSGNKIVDDAGLAAVRRAAPFAPLPDSCGERLVITYTFEAGPTRETVTKMQFNGVPIPQGGFKISSGGSTLQPLDVDTAINRKLQERESQLREQLYKLKVQLEETKKMAGEESEQTAILLQEFGKCSSALHDYKEAEASLKAALAIFEKNTDKPARTQSALVDLSHVYSVNGRLPEAEEALKRASTMESPDTPPADKRKILEEYARLLYKSNKTQEASEIYKQLKDSANLPLK